MGNSPPLLLSLNPWNLVKKSWSLLSARPVPLVLAIVCFALLYAVSQTFADSRATALMSDIAAQYQVSEEDAEETFLQSLQSMTSAELESSALQYVKNLRTSSEMTYSSIGVEYLFRILPIAICSMLASLLISFFPFSFLLAFLYDTNATAQETLLRVPLLLCKFILLSLWMFFRSFSWIPFFGIFSALYYYPRFCVAPVRLVSGDQGIGSSVQESMRRTTKRWLSVVLVLIFLVLFIILASWLCMLLAAVVSLFIPKAGFFLWLCFSVTLQAFACAYFIEMDGILSVRHQN